MKYLVLELGAIDEIVSDRFLQSTDFAQGRLLASLLKGQVESAALSPKLSVIRLGEGVFITLRKTTAQERYLVVDVGVSRLFDMFSDVDSLFMLQKLARFAKKAWQGLAFNFSERYIPQSSKAILFPFRGFKPNPFRLTIEREPWAERLEKRGDKGKFLLVYKAGYEGADATKEQPELTSFRKAYEALPELRQALRASSASAAAPPLEVGHLKVAELGEGAFDEGSIFRRFEDWLPLLTDAQRRFVDAPIEGAFRIEGAAGTGKTLALMLKAVAALRKAEAAGDVTPFLIQP